MIFHLIHICLLVSSNLIIENEIVAHALEEICTLTWLKTGNLFLTISIYSFVYHKTKLNLSFLKNYSTQSIKLFEYI